MRTDPTPITYVALEVSSQNKLRWISLSALLPDTGENVIPSNAICVNGRVSTAIRFNSCGGQKQSAVSCGLAVEDAMVVELRERTFSVSELIGNGP